MIEVKYLVESISSIFDYIEENSQRVRRQIMKLFNEEIKVDK